MAANSRFAVATHIMTSLAFHKNESLSSAYLANSVNTNPVVIRRILGELQKSGLVKTAFGKTGGTLIAKSPSSIDLLDIFTAVSDTSVFAYNSNGPNKTCALSCAMKSVLEPIFHSTEEAIAMNLKKVKLSDLVKQLEKKGTKK